MNCSHPERTIYLSIHICRLHHTQFSSSIPVRVLYFPRSPPIATSSLFGLGVYVSAAASRWICRQIVMAAKIPFYKQWIKPEIYPLFIAVATAVSMGGFVIARNIAVNPDVRISKQDREAGVLENYEEGDVYKNHSLRAYALKHGPQIMPSINNYLSGARH